jgi:YQGE family putative transporter
VSVIPIFFYVNGLLLKRGINLNLLFNFGVISQALAPLILVMIPEINIYTIIAIALIESMGVGFYWANRNYLTIDATDDEDRNYFFGLSASLLSIARIVVPVVAGYLLEFGINTIAIGRSESYFALMIVSLGFALGSVWILRDNSFHSPNISRIRLKESNSDWNLIRIFTAFTSFRFGLMLFLPALLILEFIGSEAELGVVQTTAALLATAGAYTFGKRLKKDQRTVLISIGSLLIITASLGFNIFYGATGVLLFIFAMGTSDPFRKNFTFATWYREIDRQANDSKDNYRYIFDLEVFIAVGRVIGIILFLAISNYTELETTLRLTALSIAVMEVGVWLLGQTIERRQKGIK